MGKNTIESWNDIGDTFCKSYAYTYEYAQKILNNGLTNRLNAYL